MKKTRIFILIYIIGFQFVTAQCFQLVWSDEFNGSAVDLTKWTPEIGDGFTTWNSELQIYTNNPQNIQVSNGSLKITALLENYLGFNYTSARLNTKNTGDWLYGRFESRIKLPTAVGMWPAFWMLPTDNEYGTWPKSGEMDIMELVGIQPNKTHGTIHTHNGNAVQSFTNNHTLPTGVFSDDFHVFSMYWTPNEVKIYVDNLLYFSKTSSAISPYPWVFDKRFHLLLNLAVGGTWGGAPNGSTTFPQTMEVDYVRVYQLLDQVAIIGNRLVEPNTNATVYSVPNMADTTYEWSVSGDGNTIVSGQNSSQIVVNWGNSSGLVSVLLNNTCPATATAMANVTVSGNTWSNPNFEQNYNFWETRPLYNGDADFNILTTNTAEGAKSACVQVNNAGTNPWDIQLSRTNLNLQGGTNYTLRFKAKADANRSIPIAFIRSDNYAGIANKTINLTTIWQTFTLVFTPNISANAMFNLDLAGATGTYCFDEFVFGKTQNLSLDSEPLIAENQLVLYPNPTFNIVNIDAKNRDQTMELYDLQGRKMANYTRIPEKIVLEGMQNGIYFLKTGTQILKVLKK